MSSPLVWLRAPTNAIAYRLRRALGWSRGRPELPDERKDDLFGFLEPPERQRAEARERELCERYGLEPLRARSSRLLYRENLALLDALEVLGCNGLGSDLTRLRAVDVGCGNWATVFGLHAFLRRHGRPEGREVELHGVEIDGHGVYRDLRSRKDHAEAHAGQTGSSRVRFHVADVLAPEWSPQRAGQFAVVALLHPFLTRRALLAWGLPLSLHAPRGIVARSLELLAPGGRLVALDQTAEERDLLHALLQDLGARVIASCGISSRLVRHHELIRDRQGTLACRA